MLNKNFDQELLGKIKEKKIIPKWHFLLKDYVVWFFGVLSLIIGSLSFSVIIYLAKFNDWEAYNQIGESFLSFIFLTLPYFWILFLIFFMAIVYYNIKHTKRGYRYSLFAILFGNIVVSILFGAIFFRAGVGQAIDDVLGARAPFYSEVINRQMYFWCQVNEGRLAGIVLEIKDDNNFILIDIHQRKWAIAHNIEVISKIKIKNPVRLIGEKIDDNTFKARQVLLAGRSGRGMFERHNFDNNHDCESHQCLEGDNSVKGVMEIHQGTGRGLRGGTFNK